jgi:hypothetical protein
MPQVLEILARSVAAGKVKPDDVVAELDRYQLAEPGRSGFVGRNVLLGAAGLLQADLDLARRRIPNAIVMLMVGATAVALSWMLAGDARLALRYSTAPIAALGAYFVAASIIEIRTGRRRLREITAWLGTTGEP